MSDGTRSALVATGLVVACSLLFFACFERRDVERTLLDSVEAKTNRYFAAGEFLEAMGAEVDFYRGDDLPRPGTTWILPTSDVPQFDLDTLKDWIETGGRLLLIGDDCGCAWEEIELLHTWGVVPVSLETRTGADLEIAVPGRASPLVGSLWDDTRFEAPGLEAHWRVEDEHGALLLGFRAGEGEVILAVTDTFVHNDEIAQHDHAELLWRLVGEGRPIPSLRWSLGTRSSRSGEAPGLLALLWERARPTMIAAAVLLLAWVWMRARRFGPVRPDPPPIRRRLLEHIEAAGHFSWRRDRGTPLVDAMRVRLERECARRHPGWRGLTERERTHQLAAAAHLPVATVARALRDDAIGDADAFRERVLHLEQIRKAL